jgi:mRNA interferase MazF
MKRGEVWTLRDEGFASKARPVVVIQDDAQSFQSVILCLLTSFKSDDIPTRVRVEPAPDNGLTKTSYVMTDKVVTVRREELGAYVGRLTDSQMHAVSRGLAKVLHITSDDIE